MTESSISRLGYFHCLFMEDFIIMALFNYLVRWLST